ncbi:MAG: ABC transporter permease [Bacteroidota bacterium]
MKTIVTSTDKSFLSFAELKRYGGLFKYLSLRDVFVRYKQTKVGFAWSIIRPIINVAIFGCLSYLVDRTGSFKDKFILVSAGIVFWQLISTALTDVSNSLSANANILTKVYFPKLILPASSLFVCIVDFLIAFVIFLLIFIGFKGMPPWQIILLPMVVLYGLVFSFSLGLFFATASVKYRDVKFILPFVIQILFYASPVFLSSEFVLKLHMPDIFKVLYQLNPLVFILNSFKYCFYGNFDSFNLSYAMGSIVLTVFIFVLAVKYFLNFEKSFADYI